MREPVLTHPAAPHARTVVHGTEHRIDPRRTPISIVEVDLDGARVRPAHGVAVLDEPLAGNVMALVRKHRRPLGVICARVVEGGDARSELVATAERELRCEIAAHDALDERIEAETAALRDGDRIAAACVRARVHALAEPPPISVVVATRERPARLAHCLDSLLRVDYPRFEIIVVDNAPATSATARLMAGRYRGLATYVQEPVRGLASAHNRGLAAAGGRLVAFTDDDVVVDRDWLPAVAEAFGSSADAGCVTGLILPAQLETAAQAMLERRGAFAKGFRRVEHRVSAPDRHPLFPFTAGRLGSGANMAFTADALRAIGGFDPSTGTGTAARGGDDLLAFFRVAARGYSVVYQPDALVWHHHRRESAALADQAFGYGVGLGAYLTAAIVREPRMAGPLLLRLPRGALYALRNSRTDAADPAAWPARLSRLERYGLLYGPIAYGRSRWRSRAAGVSAGGRVGRNRG